MSYTAAINQSKVDDSTFEIETSKIIVPNEMFDNWQQTLDLLSELANTPVSLIMRVHKASIEVFASSRTNDNPYKKHDSESLGHGLYCETVINEAKELHIPNALKDALWNNNPDIKLGMIAYCGLPLRWPDQKGTFGTICMLDNKEHVYSEKIRSLLTSFQSAIESNLMTLYQQTKLQIQNQELERKVQLRTQELVELSEKLIKEIENSALTETTLEYHKNYDPLTGLPNRITLINTLSSMLEKGKPKDKVSVLYLGLRNFKSINDSYGYLIGDKALLILSQRLQKLINKNTFISRIAGVEFVIIQTHKSSKNAICELIESALDCCSTPFTIDDFTITIPSSMGIAQAPNDGIEAISLIQKASAAMTISKSNGSSHSFFNQHTQQNLNLRSQLESRLMDALNKNELSLHYQPLVHLKTQRVVGAEALLRWHNPVLGNVPPDKFISLAERNGQIIDIGNFVLHTALSQTAKWYKAVEHDFKIAINISPLQIRNPRFLEHVADLLKLYQLPATALELEITEGLLLQDEHIAQFTIQKLQQLGIKISLDDFGTGYSSLSYLQKYSFNTLKIDRCFIKKLEENKQDRELTKTIIAIGKKLNLEVIAEGVETVNQDAFIRKECCDLGQGYFYGKPMTAEQFERTFIHKKCT